MAPGFNRIQHSLNCFVRQRDKQLMLTSKCELHISAEEQMDKYKRVSENTQYRVCH